MRIKSCLQEEMVEFLKEKKYFVLNVRGCADIVAKKDEIYLIKVLFNLDGLLSYHAKSLKAVSHYLGGYPFVVACVTNHGKLENDTIYKRFDIPVVTPTTFKKIIEKKEAKRVAIKGKRVVEIDTEILKKKRIEMNYTLKKLAEKIGISKKALYEIENKRVNPLSETAEKLEKVLGVKIIKKYKPSVPEKVYVSPLNSFQRFVSNRLKKIGVDNSPVYLDGFNLVAKMGRSFLSITERLVKYEAVEHLEEVASFLRLKALVVCEKNIDANIPVITKDELKRCSAKDILKYIS